MRSGVTLRAYDEWTAEFGQQQTFGFPRQCKLMMTPLSEENARRLIQHYSRFLEPAPAGLDYYEQWINGEEEIAPGISDLVRREAIRALASDDLLLVRSAIQALACTGQPPDIMFVQPLLSRREPALSSDAQAAIARIEFRAKSIDTLLSEVKDKSSFIVYARALAKERERAAALEVRDPARYLVDGALGWKNADISSFIYAGLSAFEDSPESEHCTWGAMARFLYLGKELE
jgi:hypothetical protein